MDWTSHRATLGQKNDVDAKAADITLRSYASKRGRLAAARPASARAASLDAGICDGSHGATCFCSRRGGQHTSYIRESARQPSRAHGRFLGDCICDGQE
jgi:hypothetical protein